MFSGYWLKNTFRENENTKKDCFRNSPNRNTYEHNQAADDQFSYFATSVSFEFIRPEKHIWPDQYITYLATVMNMFYAVQTSKNVHNESLKNQDKTGGERYI